MGMKAASFIINCVVFVLVVDMTVNTILFIVRREAYVNWCSQANAKLLHCALFLNDDPDKISEEDLYNCGRTWEDELKFSVLSTIVMIAVYVSYPLFIYKKRHVITPLMQYSFIWLSVYFHIASNFVLESSMKSWVECGEI